MPEVKIEPIREDTVDYDKLEKIIRKIFYEQIYAPILAELGEDVELVENANSSALIDAIRSGRLTFYRGTFQGKLNATLTKELQRLGAEWDRKTRTFKIPLSNLPAEVQSAIRVTEHQWEKTGQRIDKAFAKLFEGSSQYPLQNFKMTEFFDTTLFKTEKKINKTMRDATKVKIAAKDISIQPTLTKETRAKIAEEYTTNLTKYINDWSVEEIVKLREKVRKHVMQGGRYEDLVGGIQFQIKKQLNISYQESLNKAKFLARQETGLMMAQFKSARYQEAGVKKYIWRCVVGSPNHPVRPMHKKLDGKKFSWDNPPITSEDGARNNPGEDYNCRCYAIPVVEFKKENE